MNIIALQEFHKSLIYFGFIIINATLKKITRIKNYLTSILPFVYYYHFSERWTTFYDSTDNLPLDNALPVSPNHAGHRFPSTFIMDVCVYNQILNRKTNHVPFKSMDLSLLDAIMHQPTSIYAFVALDIQNPPELCPLGMIQSRRFFIYAIRQPHHCLG